jgi:hypothetical protein
MAYNLRQLQKFLSDPVFEHYGIPGSCSRSNGLRRCVVRHGHGHRTKLVVARRGPLGGASPRQRQRGHERRRCRQRRGRGHPVAPM